MSLTLIWLRHDLRLADNPLFQFETPPEHLMCVYVLDRVLLTPLPGIDVPRIGSARLRFLWESLIALRGELLKRGSDLLVRVGDPASEVAELAAHHGASQVRVRRDAGWYEFQDTSQLEERLGEDVELWESDGGLLFDEACLPMPVSALPSGFSAFRRKAERIGTVADAIPAPVTLPPWPNAAPRGFPALVKVCSRAATWTCDGRAGLHFSGGEEEGLARLDHYLWQSGAVSRYKQTRNGLLGADFSTRFSPWLAHGCMSARQVRDAVRAWEVQHGANESSYWVIFELLWRDYFHWAARQEGPSLFGARRLPQADEPFRAWCEGRTGMPFIDAAMGELAVTGWLSNRARQNVASYLVHDLGGDWRLGAAWFEHALLDYDVASNWGNWRYVAGVGRDPRGHRFDVLWQAERYDPDGAYVAHWLPDIAKLPPGRVRHRPWSVFPERFSPPLTVPQVVPKGGLASSILAGDSGV